MKVQIPKVFYQTLLQEYHLYNVFYGGRGGGKSESIAQCLLLLATQRRRRILCIRESQNSIDESVKALLEKWIDQMGLKHLFDIYKTTIKCTNGSEFLFMGMRSHTAVSVKSIADINITWIEEAEAFSKKSWMLLRPSVTRTKDPRIVISFNPNNADDIIYHEFVANNPPELSKVLLINPQHNPFFKGTTLELQMLDDKERLPAEEFEHIWQGKLASKVEGSLFLKVDFEPLDNYTFERTNYSKLVIACDPATTNKDYSNEYGIIVLGKTLKGEIHILDDLSGSMTPLEFVSRVGLAKEKWNCNNVVVEVNNGGDFIKAAIIEFDSTLYVKEVRASTDKVQRALPLANLMELRRVRLAYNLPKLTRQMRLLTTKGFMGARGESPDRLDACVWGVYELAEIRDKNTIYTTFEPTWFEPDPSYYKNAVLFARDVCYVTWVENKLAGIVFSVYKHIQDYRLVITDSFIESSISDIPNYLDANNIRCEGIPLNQSLPFRTYAPINSKKLDDIVKGMIPTLKTNKCNIAKDAKVRTFNNNNASLIDFEIREYAYDEHQEHLNKNYRTFYLIRLLADVVYSEFGLSKDF